MLSLIGRGGIERYIHHSWLYNLLTPRSELVSDDGHQNWSDNGLGTMSSYFRLLGMSRNISCRILKV